MNNKMLCFEIVLKHTKSNRNYIKEVIKVYIVEHYDDTPYCNDIYSIWNTSLMCHNDDAIINNQVQ